MNTYLHFIKKSQFAIKYSIEKILRCHVIMFSTDELEIRMEMGEVFAEQWVTIGQTKRKISKSARLLLHKKVIASVLLIVFIAILSDEV